MKSILCILSFILCNPVCVFPQGLSLNLLKTELFAGASKGDYSVLDLETNAFYGAELNIEISLSGGLKSQMDFLAGKFSSSERLLTGAYRIFFRNTDFLLGFSFQHIDLQAIKSNLVSFNWELYENDILTVGGSAGYEFKNFGDNLAFAELFLLIYPIDDLLASSGVSYASSDIKQTRADIILRAEYALPRYIGINPSVYFQYGGNLLTKLSFGIRLYFSKNRYLIKTHRTEGFYTARFK